MADASPGIDVYPIEASPNVDASSDVVQPPDPFEAMKRAMIGTWTGVRTDPWDPPLKVVFSFGTNGIYTAHPLAPSAESESVWHYGIDADLPTKTYELSDLRRNGTGLGWIRIAFSADDTESGTLDDVHIDGTQTSLRFDFYPTWLGRSIGPVHFDLSKVTPQ